MGVAESKFGHRVLEVAPGSPSSEGELVPYLDIIVAVNGEPVVSGRGTQHCCSTPL